MKNIFIGFLVGIILTVLIYPEIPFLANGKDETKLNYAEVNKRGDLLIFMESKPVIQSAFKHIETLRGDNVNTVLTNMQDKNKKWWQKAIEGVNAISNPKEKLNMLVESVKEKYPEADAIVLKDGFRECEVLKIKN